VCADGCLSVLVVKMKFLSKVGFTSEEKNRILRLMGLNLLVVKNILKHLSSLHKTLETLNPQIVFLPQLLMLFFEKACSNIHEHACTHVHTHVYTIDMLTYLHIKDTAVR
jgi:hypothetical protein